jgi:hypothetical protein
MRMRWQGAQFIRMVEPLFIRKKPQSNRKKSRWATAQAEPLFSLYIKAQAHNRNFSNFVSQITPKKELHCALVLVCPPLASFSTIKNYKK